MEIESWDIFGINRIEFCDIAGEPTIMMSLSPFMILYVYSFIYSFILIYAYSYMYIYIYICMYVCNVM